MRFFNRKRLTIAISLDLLVIILLYLWSFDIFTVSRYETNLTSINNINTAIYLLDDTYQHVQVKLPEVVPSNNQYAYTFSVSNYNEDKHSDTNLKYRVHIRTTTNLPIEFDLFKTLEIDGAETYILSEDISRDADGTFFRHIYTEENVFNYDEDDIDYYTLLFTFPEEYNNYLYSGIIEYIEINIESHQILQSDT